MSASHHPTDIHLRQHRAKKRNKLRARIAAAPASVFTIALLGEGEQAANGGLAPRVTGSD
jgi:hypothetical protein